MSHARFGHQRERQVAAKLTADNWYVMRAAGSKGEADLIALKAGRQPMMLQVKGVAAGPFSGFPPAERAALLDAARQAGAIPYLIHWPKHGKERWLGVDEWP